MTENLGTIYLLHFDPPYRHAKHYLGWTEKQPEERLAIHLNGKGSPLVRAQLRSGGTVTLVRIWEDVDRNFERQLKNRRNTPRTLCPICKEKMMSEKVWVVEIKGEEHPHIHRGNKPKESRTLKVMAGPFDAWDGAATWLDGFYGLDKKEKDGTN